MTTAIRNALTPALSRGEREIQADFLVLARAIMPESGLT
jgi:hypothetical protein